MTRELAISPAGASFERGDFDWRVSAATVAEAGPFSTFPGFDRVLVVVEGAGLALSHGAAAPPARVERLRPYRFSGDWETHGAPLDGVVADFNVLVRRGRVVARVDAPTIEGAARFDLTTGDAFVHVVAGEVSARVASVAPISIAPGSSLWARGTRAGDVLELTGTGVTTLVRLESALPA